jgi:hypothetical protein
MDRLNAPMKIRRERLGHALARTSTLDVYTHTVVEDDRLVAKQLGEMFVSKCGQVGARENLRRERRRGDSVG